MPEPAADGQDQEVKSQTSLHRRILASIGLSAWVIVGFFLAQVLLVAVFFGLAYVGISFESTDESLFNAVITGFVYILTVLVVIVLPHRFGNIKTSLEKLGLSKSINLNDVFVLAPVGYVVYMFLSGTLTTLAINILPGYDSAEVQEVGFTNMSHPYEYILAFMTLVVVAPIAEEVLMRGYLYGRLKSLLPTAAAMIMTAVVFGVMHGQWNVAIDVFALSLVMTYLRDFSGSIWSSIVLHMMKNGLAYYILFINPSLLHIIGG